MNPFQLLRAALIQREKQWNPTGGKIPVAFRFTEFAGEAGEVANAGKKLMRSELGLVGGSDDQTNLKEEIGDAIISLELIAQHYGIDVWQCVIDKFNKTSDKHGFATKMVADEDFFWAPCPRCGTCVITTRPRNEGDICYECSM